MKCQYCGKEYSDSVLPLHEARCPENPKNKPPKAKDTEKEQDKNKEPDVTPEEAEKENRGAVSLGNKMIDPPIAARAKRILVLAEKMGLL